MDMKVLEEFVYGNESQVLCDIVVARSRFCFGQKPDGIY